MRTALVILLCVVTCLAVAPGHAEPALVRLPLLVHMAREQGADVATRAFVDQHVQRANEIFAAYGVAFELVRVEQPSMAARMETRSDRNQLAIHVKRGVLNCFVVASLMDVDEPGRVRRGVHWHAETQAGTHYVILSAIAEPHVLAHELGHFLGNPRHSDTPGNLMSYERTDALPFLDAGQQRRLQRALHAYLRSGEIRPR